MPPKSHLSIIQNYILKRAPKFIDSKTLGVHHSLLTMWNKFKKMLFPTLILGRREYQEMYVRGLFAPHTLTKYG